MSVVLVVAIRLSFRQHYYPLIIYCITEKIWRNSNLSALYPVVQRYWVACAEIVFARRLNPSYHCLTPSTNKMAVKISAAYKNTRFRPSYIWWWQNLQKMKDWRFCKVYSVEELPVFFRELSLHHLKLWKCWRKWELPNLELDFSNLLAGFTGVRV